MKENLSSNTWASVWDGQSTYTKKTQEQDAVGRSYYITANFRRYPCLEDSILDHAAYLLGAMNGSRKRYEGLTETKNYRDAITLIKKGGYATDVKYVDKICSIVERFGLDKYDPKEIVAGQPQYVVQAGAFSLKKNARKRLRAVKKLGGDFRQAFMVKSGENYLVQAGAFEDKENAEMMAEALKKAGIEACVKVR